MLILFHKYLAEKSLKKKYFTIQKIGTEVNTRTVELYSEQRNTDIIELAVLDETTQGERCKEHHAKGKSLCTCGVILPELSAEKTELLKSETAQVMIRLSGLQWRSGARGLT